MNTVYLALLAVLLNGLLGEPKRWHPLVGFGACAARVERWLYAPSRARGVLALLVLVLPFTGLAWYLSVLPGYVGPTFSVWALYFALGHKSLHAHVRPIIAALDQGDDAAARHYVARIVSRDEATLDVIPSTCETILENGNDSVFGALFWFLCAGAPGAILYRLANTLDATWGYKSARNLHFGWAAARLDDALNWLPARLTALTYALLGQTRKAFSCWRSQAPGWDSPNAGPVMSAGAGSLGIRLGGAAIYHGSEEIRPPLGIGPDPVAADLGRALTLIRHGLWLWLAAFFVLALLGT